MSDALAVLRARLKAAHLASGELSTREISRRVHGAVSHTTAHQVLRAATLPSWRALEPVVDALGADPEDFKKLWVQARSEEKGGRSVIAKNNTYREDLRPHLAGAFNLFRHYCRVEKFEEAKAFLISQIDPPSTSKIDLVVELYDRFYYQDQKILTKYDPVIQDFTESGDATDVESAHSAHSLARRCLEQNNPQRALVFAQRAHAINPHAFGFVAMHAEALIALGLYEQAEAVATTAHELDPKPTYFFYSPLADVLRMKGDYKRLEELAEQSYENAGGPSGNEPSTYARCLLQCGKPEKAISVINAALEHDQGKWARAELLVTAAKAYCQQSSFSDAKAALQGDELFASEKMLQLEFANVLAREGLWEEAARLLERLHEVPTEVSASEPD
jgi:tetratricopeptide (TPR) repeat protein